MKMMMTMIQQVEEQMAMEILDFVVVLSVVVEEWTMRIVIVVVAVHLVVHFPAFLPEVVPVFVLSALLLCLVSFSRLLLHAVFVSSIRNIATIPS